MLAGTRCSSDTLITNTKVFFANQGNFQFVAGQRQMQLSSILKWFSEDFGNNQASQLRSIASYLPTRQAYDAAVTNSVSISYLNYDWGLNDQATERTARR